LSASIAAWMSLASLAALRVASGTSVAMNLSAASGVFAI
jgi:hypothetical protein